MTFTFTGSHAAWVTSMASNRGQAYVFVDGSYVGTTDCYSADPVAKYVGGVVNTSYGTHTLQVEVVGTAGRPAVDVDSFLVLG